MSLLNEILNPKEKTNENPIKKCLVASIKVIIVWRIKKKISDSDDLFHKNLGEWMSMIFKTKFYFIACNQSDV